jgi:GNAT superfamily N-acetyltransferase
MSSRRTDSDSRTDADPDGGLRTLLRWREPVDEAELERLYADAFRTTDGHRWSRTASLGWVTATDGGRLVGFVNVAWDGERHAILFDTAVASDRQRQGIGQLVVLRAVEEARKAGCEWVHVDFERHLTDFYAACGFRPTAAGLLSLT